MQQSLLRDPKYLVSRLQKAPIISSTSALTNVNTKRIQAQKYNITLSLSSLLPHYAYLVCHDYIAFFPNWSLVFPQPDMTQEKKSIIMQKVNQKGSHVPKVTRVQYKKENSITMSTLSLVNFLLCSMTCLNQTSAGENHGAEFLSVPS